MKLLKLYHILVNMAIQSPVKHVIILVCLFASNFCNAQILDREKGIQIDADSVRMEFDKPYFGLYKDNYSIFGPPLGSKATKENTNVKFKVSNHTQITSLKYHGNFSRKADWNLFAQKRLWRRITRL